MHFKKMKLFVSDYSSIPNQHRFIWFANFALEKLPVHLRRSNVSDGGASSSQREERSVFATARPQFIEPVGPLARPLSETNPPPTGGPDWPPNRNELRYEPLMGRKVNYRDHSAAMQRRQGEFDQISPNWRWYYLGVGLQNPAGQLRRIDPTAERALTWEEYSNVHRNRRAQWSTAQIQRNWELLEREHPDDP